MSFLREGLIILNRFNNSWRTMLSQQLDLKITRKPRTVAVMGHYPAEAIRALQHLNIEPIYIRSGSLSRGLLCENQQW